MVDPVTINGVPLNSPLIMLGVNANTTFTVPAGYAIRNMYIRNTTANVVTGGVKVGTTNGGVDVLLALPVGASSFQAALSSLLKSSFSATSDTLLYFQTVTLWNSASLVVYVYLEKATQ